MTPPASQSSHHDKEAVRMSRFWKIYDTTAGKIRQEMLNSHHLDRCKTFIAMVNAADRSIFDEVSMLSYDALLFCSISFTERDSKQLITKRDPKKNPIEFKADTIHEYLHENQISLEKYREKIKKRLEFYSSDSDKFKKLFEKVKSARYPQLLHHRYTFIGARKDVMERLFPDSIMKEFEKVPQWGGNTLTSTTRMELYQEGAKLVVDVPPHVEASPELCGVFRNASSFSGLKGMKITTQLTTQLVIEMPAGEGITIAKTMFPKQSP